MKTKVGDVVSCIFGVECNVGGFLILKQIIFYFLFLRKLQVRQKVTKST
jgi:hypothetical protein